MSVEAGRNYWQLSEEPDERKPEYMVTRGISDAGEIRKGFVYSDLIGIRTDF